jgi:putative transposase
MSRKGNCWDNAVAESFFGSLEKERINKQQISKNRELAMRRLKKGFKRIASATR